MRNYLLFIFLVCSLVLVTIPFTDYLGNRPIALKLGYTPRAEVLKIAAGEHRFLVAASNMIRVLFYFGSLHEEYANRNMVPPEYPLMYETLIQSVKLDPYNQDIYYFSQATFTWDVGRVQEVNRLLDYGMKYRKDDFNLPFWAGFNSAFFLKDYEQAAGYMARAAEISGSNLFTSLAARFFHESGRTDLGILFLDSMQKSAKNKTVRKSYQDRKKALEFLKILQSEVVNFQDRYGRLPGKLYELVQAGLIAAIPTDPYGGDFYLDADGIVKTSSKLTYIQEKDGHVDEQSE